MNKTDKEKAQVRSYRVSEETNDKLKEIIIDNGFPNQEAALSAMVEAFKLQSVSSEEAGDFSAILQRLSELYRHAAGKADDVRRTEEAKYKNKIEELESKVEILLSEVKVQEERLREASVNEKEVLERKIESISFESATYKAQLSSAEERIKELTEDKNNLTALLMNLSPVKKSVGNEKSLTSDEE